MRIALLVHVLAGASALLLGTAALAAAKGGTLHRKSGLLFVYAMLTMAISGAGISAVMGNDGNVIAGLLTAYLVTTALITVRSATPRSRRFELGAMLLALSLGLTSVAFGFLALASPTGTRGGIPPVIFFLFGAIALSGAVGDIRMLRSGTLRGAPRLTRHLWRMCWAFWIAAASFFLGPRWRVAKILPEPLLTPPLLALPVVLILLAMLYWLWRVGVRKRVPGAVSPQRV